MSDEVKALVDSRWDDYGIDLATATSNGRMRQSLLPLRHLLRR
jgi:hypothetical protein